VEYPPLVHYRDPEEYRKHFESVYCQGPILTFDGIEVRFRASDFAHAFYESSRKGSHKDKFSPFRAEKIDWIKVALEDPTSERYQGWDNKRKRYTRKRRVAIVRHTYVVVIELTSQTTAVFITAYTDREARSTGRPRTVDLIRRGPKWA